MEKAKESFLEILKEKYVYENERKRYFDNIVSLPITILGLIVAAVYVVMDKTPKSIWFAEFKPFLCILLVLSIIATTIFLYRVYFGIHREYSSFPSSSEVKKNLDEITQFESSSTSSVDLNERIQERFTEFIIVWYIQINDDNTSVNDTRMDAFHYSKIALAVSFFLAIALFTLFCLDNFY